MKTTRRLTAMTLVALLLLSLCGCGADVQPPAANDGESTTASTSAPTVTDTTASTASTTDTTQTATQTATTVVTTQVSTKITVTDPTAAPTQTSPAKPAIEWNVIKGELPEDGITPGVAFPCGNAVLRLLEGVNIEELDWNYGEIIESAAELDALAWNDPEYAEEHGLNYQKPAYTDDFFEDNVLIEFVFSAPEHALFASVGSASLDGGTLHLHLVTLETGNVVSMLLGVKVRVLVEMPREDAAKVQELVVYESSRVMTMDDYEQLLKRE